MLDVAVKPTHHVAFQWREQRFSVALESQCSGLVQALDERLAEAAAERPAHKPLQLDAARGPGTQEAR